MSRVLQTVALAMLCLGSPVHAFRVLGSMYADTGESAGGAILNKYPVRPYVDGVHKKVKIYPIAVYTDRVHRWKYNIMILKNPKTKQKIYGHVIDECWQGSSSCKKNKRLARKSGRMLVDIHKSAWKALGLKSFGLHHLKAGYVDTLSRKNKAIRKVLSSDGKKGYVAKGWK